MVKTFNAMSDTKTIYKTVRAYSLEDFDKEVNDLVSDGWLPSWGHTYFVADGHNNDQYEVFSQQMMKVIPNKTED